MKISYNWLKELIPDLTASPREVATALTMHSFETEVTGQLETPPGIKVVKITSLEPHPDADRLRLATVTDGKQETTVVCGAPNIAEGLVVPYSEPGSELVGEDGKEFIVEEAVIRGIKSPGMLNSLRELGLHGDHSGIWMLPEDTPLGSELSEHVPLDVILEADITPNRAHDCLSHIGLARELAGLLRLQIDEPEYPELPKAEVEVEGFTVSIEDDRLCPRYLAAVVQDLTLAPSPLWLQARLLAAGGKPINNLVDITNYVTFEYGNPTHLFDGDKLAGKNLGIRRANPKETITTLDEIKRELHQEDLVITAADQPVALAGVMGGESDAVDSDTKYALLEVANFNAYSVQETARRHGLRTEAAIRFSKALTPALVQVAARRTLGLLMDLADAKVTGVVDQYPQPIKPKLIFLDPDRVLQVAGDVSFTPDKSKSALEQARFKVDDSATPWQITIPENRLDIEGEHDLVEEAVRIIGLKEIDSQPPPSGRAQPLPHHIYWREAVRDVLAGLGLTETYNYSFSGQGELELANPPAPEKKHLRTSLIPGLLNNLVTNRDTFQRNTGRKESALFEIGHVYKRGEGGSVPGVVEDINLAAVVVGGSPSLENIAQALGAAFGIDAVPLDNVVTAEAASRLKYYLPIHGFEINLTELLQKVDKPVPAARTLAEVQADPTVPTQYVQVPKYPSVYRDLSLLVDPPIPIEEIQNLIEIVGGDYVADVDLFDEYQPTDSNKRGYAFHIEYRAPDRTLTDADVNLIHGKIISTLESQSDAQVR